MDMISFANVSILSSFILFSVAFGNVLGLKDTSCHVTQEAALTSLITGLKWKTLVLLFNGEEQREVDVPELSTTMISEFRITPQNLNTSLLQIHDTVFPEINIVLSGNNTFVRGIMTKVDRFDATFKITDFKHSSKWLILSDTSLELNDVTFMENVVILRTKENSPRCTPKTLTRHPTGNVFTPVSECGADVSMCYFPNVRYGYNNRHIRVYMLPGLAFLVKEIVNGKTVYSGYVVDFLHLMANRYNFSFSIVEPPDGSWGILENGSWDGIINLLQQKDMDAIGCCFAITEERAAVVDFIYPQVVSSGFTVLYRSYTPSPFYTLARPLQWQVYLITILTAGILVVIFPCFDKSQRSEGKKGTIAHVDYSKYSIVIRALFKQGSQHSPRTNAGKVLVSAWWLTLVVVTAVYTANLVASYTAVRRIHPFTTYQELIESDYQLLVQLHIKGLIFAKFMMDVMMELRTIFDHVLFFLHLTNAFFGTNITSEMALIESLRNKFDIKNNELPLKEKVRLVKEDKFALLIFSETAESLKADDCELETIQDNLFYEHFAIAVPIQSYLMNTLQRGFYRLQETGILSTLWGKWYKKRNSTSCLSDKTLNPISTDMFAGGLILLCSGVSLAVVVLVFERVYYMCRRGR